MKSKVKEKEIKIKKNDFKETEKKDDLVLEDLQEEHIEFNKDKKVISVISERYKKDLEQTKDIFNFVKNISIEVSFLEILLVFNDILDKKSSQDIQKLNIKFLDSISHSLKNKIENINNKLELLEEEKNLIEDEIKNEFSANKNY